MISDPTTKAFALDNPKKLGYLMTLSYDKLEKAFVILTNTALGDFVMRNPKQIVTLVRISEDYKHYCCY